MIYQDLYYSGMNSKCNYLYDNIDANNFNTYKLLFDYSMDHGNIKLSTSHGYTTCDKHYKNVMNNYISTYRDIHNSCKGKNEKKFYCEYFNKLFGNENYEKLTSFTCTERPYHNAFLEVPVDKAKEPDIGVLVNPASVANLNGTSSPTSIRDIDRNDHPQRYLGRYHDPILAYQPTLDDNPVPPVEDSTEGGSSKTIAGSIVPVLGVSSFSLLLYKVTPVGGYINRLLGRNRNMYNQIEYMDTFNPYNEGMDPVGRRMNISYHRL
ncbi:Plasmodium vivax Vir protein, putative [Plasmodium vivax]|nr:Plasmodium vivax Vir protein, putative [Plasmodium vivax]SCA83783.1 Plasmodium vivax Vir protein, putative [Plasmodium vivax]